MVAYKVERTVRLVSRKGVDHTARFPDLVKAIAALPRPSLVLDGVAVFDEKLNSRFEFLAEPHPKVATTPRVFIPSMCCTRGVAISEHRPWRRAAQSLSAS
jgi:hypothetical protein